MESQVLEWAAVSLLEVQYSPKWQEKHSAKSMQGGVHDQERDILALTGYAL
jgi:hypothetical protein